MSACPLSAHALLFAWLSQKLLLKWTRHGDSGVEPQNFPKIVKANGGALQPRTSSKGFGNGPTETPNTYAW